jgi:hypothetical protein
MHFLQFVEKQQLCKSACIGAIVFVLRLADQAVLSKEASTASGTVISTNQSFG